MYSVHTKNNSNKNNSYICLEVKFGSYCLMNFSDRLQTYEHKKIPKYVFNLYQVLNYYSETITELHMRVLIYRAIAHIKITISEVFMTNFSIDLRFWELCVCLQYGKLSRLSLQIFAICSVIIYILCEFALSLTLPLSKTGSQILPMIWWFNVHRKHGWAKKSHAH